MGKVIIVGLGPLGTRIVRFAAGRDSPRIVGAVDINPEFGGRDLGLHCGLKRMRVPIRPDLKSALRKAAADCAVIATVSSAAKIEGQLVAAARCGLNVVTTCEELSFPWVTQPRLAARIDAAFKTNGVACLATGVNPGFLMDFLPCILTAVNQDVRKVSVWRVQDASSRRAPFQEKIGAGLTPDEFQKKKSHGTLRHVGLRESAHMIAHAMNWRLDRISESTRPVFAKARVTGGLRPIARGMALGVEQICRGYAARREVIALHFRAAVGEKRPCDRVEIKGLPDMVSEIHGGVHGDVATCAIVLNAVRSVMAASPGLKTMLDVPAVTYGR